MLRMFLSDNTLDINLTKMTRDLLRENIILKYHIVFLKLISNYVFVFSSSGSIVPFLSPVEVDVNKAHNFHVCFSYMMV